MNYFESLNINLLSLVPLQAKNILEIGCNNDLLGYEYKLRNPSATYTGISFSEDNAKHNLKQLDVVHYIDSQSLISFNPKNKNYDCIIYHNSIFELPDAWACLNQHINWLSDTGEILMHTPDAQYRKNIPSAFNDIQPDEESLTSPDNKHARCINNKKIKLALERLGLVVHECKHSEFNAQNIKEGSTLASSYPQRIQIKSDKQFKTFNQTHYIIRAGRCSIEPLFLSGYSAIKPSSMAEVRLSVPFQALESKPKIFCTISTDSSQLNLTNSSKNKIFIWQRPILEPSSDVLAQIKELSKLGYLFVIDFDDDPDHFPEYKETDYFTFRAAHAIQVSTPQIADKIKHFNPKVRVFSNNVLSLQPQRERDASNGLKLFFGALNREKDWAPLIETLNSCLRKDPEFWSFSVIHDRAFYDKLDLPENQKTFTPLCNYESYLKEMAACDIAFLPLRGSRFNRMKSDLKAIEAGSFGLAILASHVVYRNTFIDGETAALFTTPKQLNTILRRWRNKPKEVISLGERARNWVGAHRLQCHQTEERESWYRDLCSHRNELNQALIQRLPELKKC